MNKSPPTSGGLFYFGQIAFHEDKSGIAISVKGFDNLSNPFHPVKPFAKSSPAVGITDASPAARAIWSKLSNEERTLINDFRAMTVFGQQRAWETLHELRIVYPEEKTDSGD